MTNTKLKVTICSHDGKKYFGGPYEWIKRFGPSLRDAGVEVAFLFFSDHKASESTIYIDLKNKGFDCQLLPIHSLTQYGDNTEDRMRWLFQQVIKNPPDVLIANFTLYGLYAAKWLKKAGIPVVGVLHSDDPSHEFMYEEFIGGKEEYSLSAVVAVSEFLAQKAMANNIYHIPVSVISCGTPIANNRAVYRPEPFKIVYAGKLEEVQKRIIETTYALCEVVKNIPGTQVEIYGSGSEQRKVVEIIKQEAEGYDIAFKGLIASDAMQTVFSKAQAFVLLSDYEGLPIALMEAMATGLVPVCMNMKSGIPELIVQDESGILVNNRGEEFLAAIKKLKKNPLLWQTLSENAFQKVCQTHAMLVITEKWIALLNELKQKAVSLESLKMPSSIDLPAVNPLLYGNDDRKPPLAKYLQLQVARVLNYINRSYKK